MLGHRLVIVADAHLGPKPSPDEEAFLRFLERVPALGDCLLINGDLFDFWFAYWRVIPRSGFQVAAALSRLRRRLPIVMVGGNHDRWGDSFWRDDLGLLCFPLGGRFEIGHRTVLAIHGDGVTERHWSARLLHHVTRHPATVALFHALHPDLGFPLAGHLGRGLANTERDPAALDEAARRQRQWAEALLADEPEIGLVVASHTHRPALTQPAPGRQYLNPGAWVDGYRYAVADQTGAELRTFAVEEDRGSGIGG